MRMMPTNYTVHDLLAAMERRELRVNREYQRSDSVWPDAARSYLIETILLEFPIPKFALHQVTDALTGQSHKELVDGQQRSAAIRAFREDRFQLSAAVENEALRGLRFSTLSVDQRTTFLNYQLNVDLFLGAEAAEIREVFRRMNSYTIPLNPEEQRHATFQGEFKWFLHRVALSLNDGWESMGIFTQKALVRMADTKLLAEIVHALLYGITTTNKRSLDKLYRDHEEGLDRQDEYEQYIKLAVGKVREWEELHGTALMKHFQVYSLVLAIIHARHQIPALAAIYEVSTGAKIDESRTVQRLTQLAQAVDDDVETGSRAGFVRASSRKTNVRAERETRFRYCCDALLGAT